MTNNFKLNLLASALGALMLSGCGDVETTIIEKDPIEVPDDHDDDDHDHGDDGYAIDSLGRLAVLSGDSNEVGIYDLDDGDLLDTFSLVHDSNTLSVSAGYRFAVVVSRGQDYLGFIDGGLWREDHVEHLHDYKQAPVMSDYVLTGSRPTHVVKHDGQMAVFYDGDAESGTPAAVEVLLDSDISSETDALPRVDYPINMHGVAEPRGEHLLSTVRRDDAENTSANKILPDQVAVYHLHDGEYEQEQVLETLCPDLHGAAQNLEYVAFGCSDGILLAHQHDDDYESVKIANIDALNGLRVGSIYAHEESELLIGVASGHGGGAAVLVSIDPHENEMEPIDWQPVADANPVSYAFSYEGEYFLILDNQGYLTQLSVHEHDGHSHFEFEGRLAISTEDLANMPEGLSFKMTMAQNEHFAYVADPIAQHVLRIDLETLTVSDDIELDFVPAGIAWLGIPEEEHDH